MTLIDELRDANEARLLGEVLARSEAFWGLTEARVSALEPKPVELLARLGKILARVRVARAAIYPRISPDDIAAFVAAWTPERERKLSLDLFAEEQRLTEIGVTT